MLLACANAMAFDAVNVTVADFALPGLAFGVLLIHESNMRKWSPSARSVVLAATALGAVALGSALEFKLKVSPMGIATVPLLAVLSGWLHLRERLFPALARRERGLPEPTPAPATDATAPARDSSSGETAATDLVEADLQEV